MQFTFTWQQKNSLCLQTLNFIVVSMFVFLGFVVPWAWLLLSCTVYMCVFFSPEVRTLLLRVAQSNELSIGRGDLQFMFREWVQSQQGVVFLEGMSGLQWSEYMDDIPLAGLVRTSRDPACFALCFYLHGWMKSRSTCSRHLYWDGLSEEFIRTVTQEKNGIEISPCICFLLYSYQ